MVHKAGFVNLIGKPNVGKSTLMNKLVGERISIITPKAQTTRHRIIGIVNEEHLQLVYSDTPGILEPNYALQANMMVYVREALKDADILLLIVDLTDPDTEMPLYGNALLETSTPLLIALNKTDVVNKNKLDETASHFASTFPKAELFQISALNNIGVDALIKRIIELTPESPPYYDKDALTDRPMRFFVAEIIRERIFENYHREVPYSVQVEIESYKEEEHIVRISAVIYVSRKSQKGILIGHKGERLKVVGTEARQLIEAFIGQKVFLEMHVKVDEDWRNKENRLKAFGYKH